MFDFENIFDVDDNFNVDDVIDIAFDVDNIFISFLPKMKYVVSYVQYMVMYFLCSDKTVPRMIIHLLFFLQFGLSIFCVDV